MKTFPFTLSLSKGGLCVVATLSLAACGPKYGLRVPDKLVQKLPYETRIDLLEAENDLAVAIDKMDEVENDVQRARDNIRRAKERRSAAKDEVGNATDDVSRQVAELAVDEADAKVDYLRARQKVNLANEDVEEIALRCAFARYELARYEAAAKVKIEGYEKLNKEDFENQVKQCDAQVAEMKAEMKDVIAESDAAKQTWEKCKVDLAKKTFDARASPYVE